MSFADDATRSASDQADTGENEDVFFVLCCLTVMTLRREIRSQDGFRTWSAGQNRKTSNIAYTTKKGPPKPHFYAEVRVQGSQKRLSELPCQAMVCAIGSLEWQQHTCLTGLKL